MRAYYFDDVTSDQRLPHNSGIPVDDVVLASIGVFHREIPLPPISGDNIYPEIDAIAAERHYKNRDTITITKEGLGDLYEARLKSFYEESVRLWTRDPNADLEIAFYRHMHEDEEIRYILEGSGFFDVREHPSDKWIRCAVDAGDLVVLPAGIYHRFTLDEKNTIKAMRLFKDEPKWTPYNRSATTDNNSYRQEYLESITNSTPDNLGSVHINAGGVPYIHDKQFF